MLINNNVRNIFFGLLLAINTFTAKAYNGEELEKYPKITISKARLIALKAHQGEIIDEELEKEIGGSGLRYTFDIKSGLVIQEVGVDAQNGEILENITEKSNSD